MGGLKVIGVGFGRTGTFSLKSALDRLGLRCYYAFEILNRPAGASLWMRAIDEEENCRHLLEQIFAGYETTVDFPSVYFYRELIEYYPDAKVILTLRDSNSWYESFRDTIIEATISVPYKIARHVYGYGIYKLMKKTFITMLSSNVLDRQHVVQVYEQYNADVLKHVTTERLLIYRVEQGWKPLCDFLNIPVPEDTPFPHFNERERMLGWLYIFMCMVVIFIIVGSLLNIYQR